MIVVYLSGPEMKHFTDLAKGTPGTRPCDDEPPRNRELTALESVVPGEPWRRIVSEDALTVMQAVGRKERWVKA